MARHRLSCLAEPGTPVFMRISNSFSEGEIQLLVFIVQTLLRGGSLAMVVRNKDFPSLCKKILGMNTRVAEQKARPVVAAQLNDQQESSVGTVSAPTASQLADNEERNRESSVGIARAV